MMDSGPVRNMYSTLSNKCEKQCISLALIIWVDYIISVMADHYQILRWIIIITHYEYYESERTIFFIRAALLP
jgi:hypothetical protein